MTTQFTIMKRDKDGLRLFLTKQNGQYGEVTRSRHGAILFDTSKEAENFIIMHNLDSFSIAVFDGTDDKQEWAREYWSVNG